MKSSCHFLFNRPGTSELNWKTLLSSKSQSQSCIATDGLSISTFWCRAPSGAHDQIFIIVWQLRSCFCGAPSLTRGRVCICICCWSSPAQSFSSPSPMDLATIFYCLSFETSLFVASYDSQGHGGGIRPPPPHGLAESGLALYSRGTDHVQKTQPLYCCVARTTQKTRVMCQTVSSLIRYKHWAWRGRHRKHSLTYCCVLDRVYRAVAWQRVDQIRYVILPGTEKPFTVLIRSLFRSGSFRVKIEWKHVTIKFREMISFSWLISFR
jgi:hypothetical protein